MSRKKGYRATTEDVVINGTLLSATFGFATSLYTGDSVLPPIISGGFMIACLLALAQRNASGATQRLVELAWDAPHIITKDGQQYLRFRDRTVVPTEFVFEGRGLPMGVPRSDMERFCRLAQRRTGLARSGGLHSRDILSKGYFTRRYHKPFLPEEYETVHKILAPIGLWRERKQGRSGRLYHIEGMSVDSYVDEAQTRWAGPVKEQSPALPNFRLVEGQKWQLV